MSAIDDLAAEVRAHLAAVDQGAMGGYLHAPPIPGYTGWDQGTVAALPPAVSVLVQRDVASRRALLARILAEPHGLVDADDPYPCPRRGTSARCQCGRDERVAGYLEILAQAYREGTQ